VCTQRYIYAMAAPQLNRVIRGYLGRCRTRRKIWQRVLVTAAITIQVMWRGKRARMVREQREYRKEWHNATHIERVYVYSNSMHRAHHTQCRRVLNTTCVSHILRLCAHSLGCIPEPAGTVDTLVV